MVLASSIVFYIILNIASGDSQDYSIPSEISQNSSLSKAIGITNLRQEKLQKLTQIINCLLMGELEKDYNVMLEDYRKNKEIKYSPNGCLSIEDILTTKDLNGDMYITEYDEELPKNSTIDLDRIIAKITEALEKVKNQNKNTNQPEYFTDPFDLIPIFRLNKNGFKNNLKPDFGRIIKDEKQTETNTQNSRTKFEIPCQRAADIFKETSTFVIPKCAYCDDVNHDFVPKNTRQISKPKRQIPLSDQYIDPHTTIAVLYKPKTVPIMQVIGNLLKKITTTILVPFHVIKFFDN